MVPVVVLDHLSENEQRAYVLPTTSWLNCPDGMTRYSHLNSQDSETARLTSASWASDSTRSPVQARRSLFRVHPAGNYCFLVDAPASLP